MKCETQIVGPLPDLSRLSEFHCAWFPDFAKLFTLTNLRVNAVSNGQLRGEAFTTGCLGVRGARIWFFFGFLLGFGALIGACWILFGEYLIPSKHSSVHATKNYRVNN